jgi:hypothetical protein
MLAAKRVGFLSERMSYILLVTEGRWCDVIVPNVHTPTKGKTGGVKASFYEQLGCVFPKVHKQLISKVLKQFKKIYLGNFDAKVCRNNIFKSTIENKSEISNGNGI